MESARLRAGQLENFRLSLTAKAGGEGKLFGSIGTADIAEALSKAGIRIERSEVRLAPVRSGWSASITSACTCIPTSSSTSRWTWPPKTEPVPTEADMDQDGGGAACAGE